MTQYVSHQYFNRGYASTPIRSKATFIWGREWDTKYFIKHQSKPSPAKQPDQLDQPVQQDQRKQPELLEQPGPRIQHANELSMDPLYMTCLYNAHSTLKERKLYGRNTLPNRLAYV